MDDEQIQVMGIFVGMEGISPTINCGNMGMGCIDHIDKCWVILGENQRVNLWDLLIYSTNTWRFGYYGY